MLLFDGINYAELVQWSQSTVTRVFTLIWKISATPPANGTCTDRMHLHHTTLFRYIIYVALHSIANSYRMIFVAYLCITNSVALRLNHCSLMSTIVTMLVHIFHFL